MNLKKLFPIFQAKKQWHKNFNFAKKGLIDHACKTMCVKSIADLGAVWNVDGAYTFYAIDKWKVKKAYLVDMALTDAVRKKSERRQEVSLIEDVFGNPSIPEQIKHVDAIFLFDVLLHQVKPDWNAILDLYAPITNCFVIYNQQYTASKKTIRLLDLGYEEYMHHVPHEKEHPTYKAVFQKMNERHPEYKDGRLWKDIHAIWQWGIVDEDLILKMKELGFSLQLQKNYGRFGKLENFENHGFIFKKMKSL